MSASVNPSTPDATSAAPANAGVPGPRGSSTAPAPTEPRATADPTAGGAAPTGLTAARFALVVVVSAVLSVAASVSVVALMDPGDDAVQPAAVVQEDQGQQEPDAVEQGASRELTELAERRADALCPSGSYPPVAC